MSTRERRNRLSPPLLHAFREAHRAGDSKRKMDLRDETGERVIAGRRALGRAPITEAALRREVGRDLENLLNTIQLASTQDLSAHEEVRHSIINFGIPDIVHRSYDEFSVADIKDEVLQALIDFEPRMVPGSIEVARDAVADPAALKVRFSIRADLFCEPVNTSAEFVADVDVGAGKIAIVRT
jgi:type VI secretion system protein ImpF